MDAVQASKVVSARTSSKLIHKLEALCSDYEGTQLQRQVYVDGRPKRQPHPCFTASMRCTAPSMRAEWCGSATKDGGTRTVSPWQLAWENGCYYLIAYQDEKEPAGIRNYRVDRMSSVTVLGDARRAKAEFRQFDLPAYLRKHFNMFGGPEYRVTLRCTADLEAPCATAFGKRRCSCRRKTVHIFTLMCRYASAPSSTAGCGFGGKVEVTAPAEVRGYTNGAGP